MAVTAVMINHHTVMSERKTVNKGKQLLQALGALGRLSVVRAVPAVTAVP